MRLIQKRYLFIKNENFKSCINCINFMEEKTLYPYQCKKFGIQDLVTGKIENEFALLCRTDNTKCGETGKYFEKKH